MKQFIIRNQENGEEVLLSQKEDGTYPSIKKPWRFVGEYHKPDEPKIIESKEIQRIYTKCNNCGLIGIYQFT